MLAAIRGGHAAARCRRSGHASPQALAGLGASGTTVALLDLKTASDTLLHNYRREALLLASFGSGVIAVLLFGLFPVAGGSSLGGSGARWHSPSSATRC